MQIIARGIATLVAVVTLAAGMVLGNATAGADPSDPYGPGPGPVIPLPGCPGFRCFGTDPHATPEPQRPNPCHHVGGLNGPIVCQ